MVLARMINRYIVLALCACFSACSFAPLQPLPLEKVNSKNASVKKPPVFLAHGASSGAEPLNSMAAIKATLANPDYDGIEIDLVLTGDSIPILAHDPWINEDSCRRKDGEPFEQVLIKDIAFDELTRVFECRFLSAKNQTAAGEYHSLISLSEAFDFAKNHPNKILYLDLKIQEKMTQPAVEYAAEIYHQLVAAEIGNRIFIEVPEPAQIHILEAQFGDYQITKVLSYPAFYAGENWNEVGAWSALKTFVFPSRPLTKVMDSGADMLMSPTVVMSYSSIKKLHHERVLFGTFLVETPKALSIAIDHGADVIITDITPEHSPEHMPKLSFKEKQ
jgi:glycerophosphoryl diester phosphodiesterase